MLCRGQEKVTPDSLAVNIKSLQWHTVTPTGKFSRNFYLTASKNLSI